MGWKQGEAIGFRLWVAGFQPAVSMPSLSSLPRRFAAHLDQQALLEPGQRVAVAVSGGSDSVALLFLLHACAMPRGLRLGVAHFEHGLRPESAADAAFVAALARRLHLPFWCCRTSRLSPRMPNLEAAARRLRYRFFRRLLLGPPPLAQAVATAHTLDDQAETVLLRLLRGAGTRGLCGIWPSIPSRTGQVIRPLLPFTRAELQAWLRAEGEPWREDATNRDLRRRRNRIRHELLPRLERDYNPRLRHRLAALAEILRAEEVEWTRITTEDCHLGCRTPGQVPGLSPGQDWSAPTPALAALPPARLRRLLRRVAAGPLGSGRRELNFAAVEALAAAVHAAAAPAPATRPRLFQLGQIVFRVTPRWVRAGPAPAPASVILDA